MRVLATVFLITTGLLVGCGGSQQAPSVNYVRPQPATPTPARQASPAYVPAPISGGISFPAVETARLPLQTIFERLVSDLERERFQNRCGLLAGLDDNGVRNPLTVRARIGEVFGPLAQELQATLARLEASMPEVALTMTGLQQRMASVRGQFATGVDYLTYAMVGEVLARACSSDQSISYVAADAVRLVSSTELVYQWLFDMARAPFSTSSLNSVQQFAGGSAGLLQSDAASITLRGLWGAQAQSSSGAASPGDVRLSVVSSSQLTFDPSVEINDTSITGTHNGVIDHGDLVRLELIQRNTGLDWRFSESLVIRDLPACSAIFSRAGEVILAEQPPQSAVTADLPLVYFADTCGQEETIRFDLVSSRTSDVGSVDLTVATRPTFLSIMPLALDEDIPGSSRFDGMAGAGAFDAIEFQLQATTAQPALDIRLRDAAVLPWRGVNLATFTQPTPMSFVGSEASRTSEQDLDLQLANFQRPDLNPDSSILDEMGYLWIMLTVEATNADGIPRGAGSATGAVSGATELHALRQALDTWLAPRLSAITLASPEAITSALATASSWPASSSLPQQELMSAMDTLSCSTCDQQQARDLGRRVLIALAVEELANNGLSDVLDTAEVVALSVEEGLAYLRSRALSWQLQSNTGLSLDEQEIARVLRTIDTMPRPAAGAAMGPDYVWRRFVAIPLEM